ncbi:hypothetical protein BRADI_5g18717v3 [Brachypodium distachyon]|uniref:Homeobox domain-containing protein n=2 Tax=Brachypodium distachyon TaxID=15368 RepID=A0A0Q3ECH5_BRADI|nr:hypothetical protein BRADI_5g18717v3 [Brachypodium distachyon]
MPREKAMSFLGFSDDDGGDGALTGMELPFPGAGTGVFIPTPALSVATADAAGHGGDGGRVVPVGCAGGGTVRSASEAENERRSRTIDHLDVVSGGGFGRDDDAACGMPRKRKRPYVRHSSEQIQELQALFDKCPHPDEMQRAELSRRLFLDPSQVKFWFQNRRTQTKAKLVRDENVQLRQENDRLRAENLCIREAMRHPVCGNCGRPVVLGVLSLEEQHLRAQNARLTEELSRVCAASSEFLGKSISLPAPLQTHQPEPMPGSRVQPAAGGVGSVPSTTVASSTITEFTGTASTSSGTAIMTMSEEPLEIAGIDKSVLLELAKSAMDELVKMAQMEDPLWTPSVSLSDSPAKETLNYEEYLNTFSPCIGVKPAGFQSEASRESGIVISDDSVALVEALMDERRWSNIFSCMVAKSSTIAEISTGVAGSRDGALLLIQAELQVLSPLVPIRKATFLRFCKQLGEGAWAVVDVSIDGLVVDQGLAAASTTANMNCRRLPSGCLVQQDTRNGFCKVKWVEHAEYDESSVHPLYRSLLRSGLALGAGRWLATLQRQCKCWATLQSCVAAWEQYSSDVLAAGTQSLLKLAQRMMESFFSGVSASSALEWSKLDGFTDNIGNDVRIIERKSVDEPGVPPGVVLCAATSVWMLVTPERLFQFLCDEGTRAEWDILSTGGPMQEVTNIAKGQQDGNTVSLLRTNTTNTQQNGILILQETCTDASGSMVVYAPVDIPAMHLVMSGGDSASVPLLPSGFVILPDGPTIPGDGHKTCGSLLTFAFQILVKNSEPTAKLTVESIQTVNNLISCTINRIKTALHCDV